MGMGLLSPDEGTYRFETLDWMLRLAASRGDPVLLHPLVWRSEIDWVRNKPASQLSPTWKSMKERHSPDSRPAAVIVSKMRVCVKNRSAGLPWTSRRFTANSMIYTGTP